MVYPACAGIHPTPRRKKPLPKSLPRMRGDPPYDIVHRYNKQASTPHARGSTSINCWLLQSISVYPACAGIHPLESGKRLFGKGLPRMRGDPPPKQALADFDVVSTPHARGSTLPDVLHQPAGRVYPACAGIHPAFPRYKTLHPRLPRMRGDPPSKQG